MNGTEAVSGYLSAVGLESWVVQVFVVVLATAVLTFGARRFAARLHATFSRTPSVWDESFVEALGPPLRAFVWIAGIAFAIEIIQNEAGAAIFEAVDPIRDVGIIATVTWFAVRFIRIAESNFIADKQAKGEAYDRATFDAVAKLLRLSVLITAFLVALQTLGFSISGVLAFGGIGGIAVGFAAKDLLANFFGGLMIYLDRPFAVGDWIRSPDREIEGTVELIGWRQTVIRGFDTRPLYIPNSAFANIAVENPSRMRQSLDPRNHRHPLRRCGGDGGHRRRGRRDAASARRHRCRQLPDGELQRLRAVVARLLHLLLHAHQGVGGVPPREAGRAARHHRDHRPARRRDRVPDLDGARPGRSCACGAGAERRNFGRGLARKLPGARASPPRWVTGPGPLDAGACRHREIRRWTTTASSPHIASIVSAHTQPARNRHPSRGIDQ